MDKEYFNKKLLEIIRYLNINNKFFQEFISDNCIDLNDENALIYDLLPVTTKKDFSRKDYITITGEKNYLEITSGSTGQPVKCYKNQREIFLLNNILWRNRKAIDNEVNTSNFFSMYGKKTKISCGDFFNFDTENMIQCFTNMKKQNPRWLCGPLSTIKRYAMLVKDSVIINKSIKFIELTGEVIDEEGRKILEETFQAKVVNHYGLRECWCVAYECKNGNLHLADNIYAETNEHNEIIVTSLSLRTMPIIKYNTKDCGEIVYSKCECGNNKPILRLHGGRSGQVILGSNEMLGDLFFKRLFSRLIVDGYDFISAYRVEQCKIDTFNVYLQMKQYIDKKQSKQLESTIRKMIRERLSNEQIIVNFIYYDVWLFSNGKNNVFTNKCEVDK